jgi:deoxyribodipyrimidine photo-lyase
MQSINIAWFRQDLRIQDNSMLAAATVAGLPLLPVYIHAPAEDGQWPAGAASSWWLHHALQSLQDELSQHGVPLVYRKGSSSSELQSIIEVLRESGYAVQQVFSSRLYEPAAALRDSELQKTLESSGIGWQQSNSSLLIEPEQLANKSGLPYRVFTPFWKQLRQMPIAAPVHVSTEQLRAPGDLPASLDLADLELLPGIDWDQGFKDRWKPNLQGAQAALDAFLAGPVLLYHLERDRPGVEGTSSLSPYLHFGQLGPRQVWAATHATVGSEYNGVFTFLSELAWREFAYHLMHHFPHTDLQPLNERYAAFPWQPSESLLQAWQTGQTGYPLVDAGMRQLWHTGWMHNRVRMVVASFLVKHLLQPWQDGARWFWDTLVDADLASNSMGWQWVAGSGADASPYFRIFNPYGQGEKFDPEGDYVRHWVPELAQLPAKYIHRPWEAPAKELQLAGVQLGENYPLPIIEHKHGRERALEALAEIRKN